MHFYVKVLKKHRVLRDCGNDSTWSPIMCRRETQCFSWVYEERDPALRKMCALKILYHKSSLAFTFSPLSFNYSASSHVIHTRTDPRRQHGCGLFNFASLLPPQLLNSTTADLASPAQNSGTALDGCQLPIKPEAHTWTSHFKIIFSLGSAEKRRNLPGGAFLQWKPPNPDLSWVVEEETPSPISTVSSPLLFLFFHLPKH